MYFPIEDTHPESTASSISSRSRAPIEGCEILEVLSRACRRSRIVRRRPAWTERCDQGRIDIGVGVWIGVGISDLAPEANADRTADLLDPDAPRRAAAERATDAIRAKFGTDAIIKGRALR